jgi:acyl-coenzyme A synthetase/AMP-(fatty) acid ligase
LGYKILPGFNCLIVPLVRDWHQLNDSAWFLLTYKNPREIEFIDELPKTVSGKIRRVELRQQEESRKLRK